jgi:phosphohistidine phosphatase SixA
MPGAMMRLPRGVLLVFWVLIFLPACAAPQVRDPRAGATAPTTAVATARENFVNARAIVIFRHADIDVARKATMGNATPLLPAGAARAREIITALRDAGVTRVLVSPALRTQATGLPLAESMHVKEEDAGATAQEVLAYLSQTAKPGETIVLVHHHAVIPGILAGLGVANESIAVDATEYDRVYVILPDAAKGTYAVLRLRYGGKWGE